MLVIVIYHLYNNIKGKFFVFGIFFVLHENFIYAFNFSNFCLFFVWDCALLSKFLKNCLCFDEPACFFGDNSFRFESKKSTKKFETLDTTIKIWQKISKIIYNTYIESLVQPKNGKKKFSPIFMKNWLSVFPVL